LRGKFEKDHLFTASHASIKRTMSTHQWPTSRLARAGLSIAVRGPCSPLPGDWHIGIRSGAFLRSAHFAGRSIYFHVSIGFWVLDLNNIAFSSRGH
jgi:hypothetical protein